MMEQYGFEISPFWTRNLEYINGQFIYIDKAPIDWGKICQNEKKISLRK